MSGVLEIQSEKHTETVPELEFQDVWRGFSLLAVFIKI